MNKTELIAVVAEKTGLTKKDAERVVGATFETLTASLKKGEKVQISGFGIFEVKERMARVGRNPKTGRSLDIPAANVPAFKASYDVKVGDKLEITMGPRTIAVEVLVVADNVRKDDACAMYKEI